MRGWLVIALAASCHAPTAAPIANTSANVTVAPAVPAARAAHWQDAIRDLERTLEEHPDDPVAASELAKLWFHLGELDDATWQCMRALRHAGGSLRAQLLTLRADIARREADYTVEREYRQRAVLAYASLPNTVEAARELAAAQAALASAGQRLRAVRAMPSTIVNGRP